MKVKRYVQGLIVLLVVGLAALACGGGTVEPTATPLPRPTQRPVPTNTEPAATRAAPTALPEEEPTDTPEAPFVLSDEPYEHPSGAFSVRLPDGWELDESDYGIFAISPDNVAAAEVTFTNVGHPLDEDALTTYITAVEDNWFGGFEDYSRGDLEPQANGMIGVIKTLNLDAVPNTVFSYYWQEGNVVYHENFWVESDEYETYANPLVEVAISVVTDDAAAEAAAGLYQLQYQFAGPGNLFEIYVPLGWPHAVAEFENSIVDTFTSPDEATYIENITYDDGEAVSKSLAGAFALALLKEYYQVDDIRVTSDTVQPDGSERLTWHSEGLGVEGESFFETRGTTFLLLTWIVDSEAYDLYQPVWANVLGTYVRPTPEP